MRMILSLFYGGTDKEDIFCCVNGSNCCLHVADDAMAKKVAENLIILTILTVLLILDFALTLL